MDKKYFFFDIDGTLTDNVTKKMGFIKPVKSMDGFKYGPICLFIR